jgi:SHS family lactate transporter-like MFS transporter
MLHLLRSLTPNQRGAVIASYLGWTLDAFDFFILVFVLKDVAQEFHTDVKTVTYAIFLTLAARPRWGAAVWHRCRPLRPAAGAYDRYSAFFDARICVRLGS